MKRTAFHRMDLLVTLFLVMVMTSIALPALQDARKKARNVSCSLNLKQMGLAMHNYHDTYNTLPPGWVAKTDTPNSDGSFGWSTSILPFIEQPMLFDSLDKLTSACRLPTLEKGKSYKADSMEALLQSDLSIYRCRYDLTSTINTARGNFGTSNYSGNFGSIPVSQLGPSDLTSNWPGTSSASIASSNGMFFWNSKVRFADVYDGLSNTILIGERGVQNGAGIWPGIRSNAQANDSVSDCAYGNEYNTTLSSFSSQHKGGMNVLFGDGRVSFMSDDIDSQPDQIVDKKRIATGVYQKIAARNDQQVTNVETHFEKAQD